MFLLISGSKPHHGHNKTFFLVMFVYYVEERFGAKCRTLELQVTMFLLITNREEIEFPSQLIEEYSP